LAPPGEPDWTLWVVLTRSKNAGPLKYEKREEEEASKTSNGGHNHHKSSHNHHNLVTRLKQSPEQLVIVRALRPTEYSEVVPCDGPSARRTITMTGRTRCH
jgi:hypothetical protein